MGVVTALASLFRPAPTAPLGLWESSARQAVLDGLQRARMSDDAERRKLQQALHAFLDGDHRAELEARLAVLYPETSKIWNTQQAGHRYFPLIQMYADRLAVCFASPPDLWLEDAATGERLPDTDPRVAQLARDVQECGLRTALPTVERWVSCGMRTALIQPMLRRGRIVWQPHAPYEVWIDQDASAPGEIDGAPHVTVILPQRSDSGAPIVDQDLYHTWEREDSHDAWGRVTGTAWRVWLHDEAGNLYRDPLFADPTNRNAYGRHPFGVWRDGDPPSGSFWGEANRGWYHEQLSADVQLCDLDHHARHQIHSQLFGRGLIDWIGKTLPSGPDRPILTAEIEASLSYLTPAPLFDALMGVFNFSRRTAAVAEGLPPDTWEASSSTRNLGAKQLEQAALKARRTRVQPYYERALRETFAAHVAVGDHWAQALGRVRYGSVRLGIELAALPEVVDRFQGVQATIAAIGADLDNPVDALMRDQGITRSAAIETVIRNRAGGLPVVDEPEVEAAALNGAQVQAATSIVTAVATGSLPRDAAAAMLGAFFGLGAEQAEAVLGSAGAGFVPAASPVAPPSQGAAPPIAAAAGEGVERPASVQD